MQMVINLSEFNLFLK